MQLKVTIMSKHQMSLSFSELTDAQHLYFSNRIWLLNLQPVHIRASPTDLLRLPWPERHWIMAQMCLKTPQRAQHLKNCTSFNHSFDHSFNHSFNHQIHLNMLNTVLGVPGNIWKSCLSRMLRIYENNVRSQFNHRLHRLHQGHSQTYFETRSVRSNPKMSSRSNI